MRMPSSRIALGGPLHCRPYQQDDPPSWLSNAEQMEREALARVKLGAVARRCGRFFDGVAPYPVWRLPDFELLFAMRRVVIRRTPHDPLLETVLLTDAGQRRLAELNNPKPPQSCRPTAGVAHSAREGRE